MGKNLQVFSFEGKEPRVVEIDGEPWWIGKDVCDVLGYADANDSLKRHCKHAQILKTGESPGLDLPSRGMTIIPESDVYRLIIRSNLPEAERFERWVMEEVLPSIRKHGAYMTPQKIEESLVNPDTMIKILQALKKEQTKARELEAKVVEDYPKVLFADSVAASHTSILVGELAKLLRQNGIGIGQNRLFERLREEGYLMKEGTSRNMPTQRSMEMGLFEIKERTITNPDGSIRTTKTPMVTGRGQIYFINKFRGKQVAA
jgi:prophage antirepressor-like protein